MPSSALHPVHLNSMSTKRWQTKPVQMDTSVLLPGFCNVMALDIKKLNTCPQLKTLPNLINKTAQASKALKALNYVSLESTPDPSVTVHPSAYPHPFEPQVTCVRGCASQHCPGCLQGSSSVLSELLPGSPSRLALCKSLLPTPWKIPESKYTNILVNQSKPIHHLLIRVTLSPSLCPDSTELCLHVLVILGYFIVKEKLASCHIRYIFKPRHTA